MLTDADLDQFREVWVYSVDLLSGWTGTVILNLFDLEQTDKNLSAGQATCLGCGGLISRVAVDRWRCGNADCPNPAVIQLRAP